MAIRKEYNKQNQIAYISRTRNYVDEEGNIGTETEIYKKTYGGKHFWRVWLGDLLYTLGLINNNKQFEVIFHVLDNTNTHDNLYIGTLRKTAEKTGVSYSTVAEAFKKMQEHNMIVMQQSGVYKVNPKLLIKGDDKKKQRLIVEYEKIKTNEVVNENENKQ